ERTGRTPTAEQLSRDTELGVDEVLAAQGAYHAMIARSLDVPSSEGDQESMPLCETALLGVEEPGYGRVEDRATMRPALRRLSLSERRLLRMRFVEERTQADIAAHTGISQMQV